MPSFTEQRFSSHGRGPFGVVAADFNRDGLPDLAVTNTNSNATMIFLGTGPEAFAAPRSFPGGRVARGIAATDLNRDGNVDLVVANALTADVTILLGDGHGNFATSQHSAGVAPFNVDIADLDGDGNLDIAVADESNRSPGRGHVTLLFGDGHGGISRTQSLLAGTFPSDVKSADLNGDGVTDLAAVNWGSHDFSIFFGRGGGAFSEAKTLVYPGVSAYSLAVTDINGDSKLDLVTGDLSGHVFLFLGDGKGAFFSAGSLTAQAGIRCLVTADLNGDGIADLATANTMADTVSVFIGHGGSRFGAAHNISVGKHPRCLAAADVNADSRLDLIVTNETSDDVSLLLNSGNGAFEPAAG